MILGKINTKVHNSKSLIITSENDTMIKRNSSSFKGAKIEC